MNGLQADWKIESWLRAEKEKEEKAKVVVAKKGIPFFPNKSLETEGS